MSYSVIPVDKFKKAAKKLVRKFPSLKIELKELNEALSLNPTMGIALGNNVYKIRISIKNKGAGKSGGGRVITYVVTEEKEISLLMIYDKADLDSVDDSTLKKIIKDIRDEI